MSFINYKNSDFDVTAPVFEGYSVETDGDLRLMEESYEDQLAIIESIHALDLEDIAATSDINRLKAEGAGDEEIEARLESYFNTVVTEGMVNTAWERIKKFFKDMWGKLKAFYASVIRFFDGVFKSGSDFAKKYDKQLRGVNLKGYEVKMFEYSDALDNFNISADPKKASKEFFDTIVGVANSQSDSQIASLKTTVARIKDRKDEEIAKYRGAVAKGSGSLSAEQFRNAMYEHFRHSGARSPEDKKMVKVEDIGHYIDTLKSNEAKGKIEEVSRNTDTEFNELIQKISQMESKVRSLEIDKDTKKYKHEFKNGDTSHEAKYSKDAREVVLGALQAYSNLYASYKDVWVEAFRLWRVAWVERDSTYKQVCIGALRHKVKKD